MQLHQHAVLRGQRHLLDHGARARQRGGGLRKGFLGFGLRVAPLQRAAHADARLAFIGQIQHAGVAHHDRSEERDVRHRPRKAADRVQGLGQAFHARARHGAERGLEAHDAAVRRGPDDRARRLRTQRERHHVVGHRGGRAAGRAARRVGLVARIARGAGLVGGELGGHGLADDDGARAAAQRHRCGIQPGTMAIVDGRAVAGGKVRGIEQVFDADGQAMQRAAQGAAVEFFGLIQRSLLLQGGPRMDGVLALLDARKTGAHQLHRG
ncbi:hypothetical protein D3C72_1226020 [compost metagenome]